MIFSGDNDFYASAERRIWRLQLAFACLGTLAAWWLAGAKAAAAFLTGAAISSLNFFWLQQAVDGVVETAAGAGTETVAARRKRRLLVAKFLGRYALLAVASYVILKSNPWNAKALLAGLLLFVAAILAEIGFELITGFLSKQDGT